MKDIEYYYDKMIQEVSDERFQLIQSDIKELEKFMEEVTNAMAEHADYLYDQWKDKI